MAFTDYAFRLDEKKQAIQQAVREFAKTKLAPIAKQVDESDQCPRELWFEMGKLGILGLTAETKYGGLAMGYLTHAMVMEEISRASAAIGLSYAAHSNLCVDQLVRYASDEQKARYLPDLISGRTMGALAMTEPMAGSDITSLSLSAVQDGQRFILNGRKTWITNGPHANVLIVYAKTAPKAGSKGITAFIIENTFDGFSVGKTFDKLGMRGSDTSELVFDQCIVPDSQILGPLNQGISRLMSGLDYERLILSAGPLGIMQACLDVVIPYVRERQQFSQPIGTFQLIQAKLADMFTAVNSARAYVYGVAHACDQGYALEHHQAASVILYTAEKATEVALQAIQCLGANGYNQDYPTGRLLRDAKLYEIGAGTSEIRRILIGRKLYQHAG